MCNGSLLLLALYHSFGHLNLNDLSKCVCWSHWLVVAEWETVMRHFGRDDFVNKLSPSLSLLPFTFFFLSLFWEAFFAQYPQLPRFVLASLVTVSFLLTFLLLFISRFFSHSLSLLISSFSLVPQIRFAPRHGTLVLVLRLLVWSLTLLSPLRFNTCLFFIQFYHFSNENECRTRRRL